MESKKIITVRDLVKNYGQFQAVKGISFDVVEGEIFGLLGPNGAGKSTTLEIIETLREKTSGEVIVDGFKEPEEADPVAVCFIVEAVADGRDAAEDLAVALSEEVFGLRMFEEGVLTAGEQ